MMRKPRIGVDLSMGQDEMKLIIVDDGKSHGLHLAAKIAMEKQHPNIDLGFMTPEQTTSWPTINPITNIPVTTYLYTNPNPWILDDSNTFLDRKKKEELAKFKTQLQKHKATCLKNKQNRKKKKKR